MYIIKMSTSLIKTFRQFSIFKENLNNIVRQGQFLKRNVSNLSVMYNHYDYYHTTSLYFRENIYKKKVIDPKTTKRKCPVVNVWKNMTVSELADVTQRDVMDVISAASIADKKQKYSKGTVFENLLVLSNTLKKLGYRYKIVPRPDELLETKKDHDIFKRPPPDNAVLVKRRPVVTIMGHVDHGKTTLLDVLRSTSVVETEFGGITQHIGAFNVELSSGEKVTFLDTPGHAAFTSMRERGAQVTDIVVLVIAADDGVMEQTIESINMAKAANVPIIVAINKIDKPNADIAKTQRMLQEIGICVEQLGGDVQCVNISALKGTNLDTLIETIALQAEIMNITGDPTGLAEGVVIECRNDASRGKLSTALIQRGTLKKGAILVSGMAWAKVRSMFDHAGKPIIQAGLSDAIQIMGWRELPNVGDEIIEVESEQVANTVIKFREQKFDAVKAEEHKKVADEKLQDHLIVYKKNLLQKRALQRAHLPKEGPRKKEIIIDSTPTVNLVIKADVGGSVEAILDIIDTYTADETCRLNVVHYGIGPITESDVELAIAFNAIIYRFNVSIPTDIQKKVKMENIPVRSYNVIYKLVDDIKNEINLKLPSKETEEIIGEANVLKTFEIVIDKKKVIVAGCLCTKGNLKKNQMYRLVRDEEVIYTGKLRSLRHIKNEVESIKNGTECGLRFDNSSITYQPGDKLVCFRLFKEPGTIDWNPGF